MGGGGLYTPVCFQLVPARQSDSTSQVYLCLLSVLRDFFLLLFIFIIFLYFRLISHSPRIVSPSSILTPAAPSSSDSTPHFYFFSLFTSISGDYPSLPTPASSPPCFSLSPPFLCLCSCLLCLKAGPAHLQTCTPVCGCAGGPSKHPLAVC